MRIDNLLSDMMNHGQAADRHQRSLALKALKVFSQQIKNDSYGKLLKMLVLRYAQVERTLASLNRELVDRQGRLDQDLWAAAQIQRSLLPQMAPDLPGLVFSWHFEPCDLMGGDLFNVVSLNDEYLSCYLFDVSGHGVPAALVTVSVSQMLQPASGLVIRRGINQAEPTVVSPREVVMGLDREFPVERFDKTFSIVYLLLHLPSRRLRYCNAGHPAPLLLRAGGHLEPLEEGGAIVGFGGWLPYSEGEVELHPGDKLFMFTDGLTEFEDAQGNQYGEPRLRDILSPLGGAGLEKSLQDVMGDVELFGSGTKPKDDISILGCQIMA